MNQIQRRYDMSKMVFELGNNKVDVLELLREALSNAKDHEAQNLYVRAKRDNRGQVSLLFMDDGHGLTHARWEAFWGAAVSSKVEGEKAIGYKGFGTKLFFHCGRLSVASRASTHEPWRLVSVDEPYKDAQTHYEPVALPESSEVHRALRESKLIDGTGIAIFIEDLRFSDKDRFLSYDRVVSYCDWFTILGDIRSGLFDKRAEFHRALKTSGPIMNDLCAAEVPIKPIQVHLQINGDKKFAPLGSKELSNGHKFFDAWQDDTKEFGADSQGFWAFGHRFADTHRAAVSRGGQRKNDGTALRLTGVDDWLDQDGYALVAHIEGHRRQRETYPEAGSRLQSQSKRGIYSFDERFGLWLCRDFVPVAQRNDLLKRAISIAAKRGLDEDFKTLRNWKVFVNHQGFLPIANRGDISNFSEHEDKLLNVLIDLLKKAFKQDDFQEWIEKLQSARRERERESEKAAMAQRLQAVVEWSRARTKDSIDPIDVGLVPRGEDESLRMKPPQNEQELFYLYAQLSAKFKVPLFILEYNTKEGVDAIGRVSVRGLLPSNEGHARVEFKYEVESGFPIGHYFDAIDVIICWKVGRAGPIHEEGSSTLPGELQRRPKPVLDPPFDTHEIVYEQHDGSRRTIPVLQLQALFETKSPPKGRR